MTGADATAAGLLATHARTVRRRVVLVAVLALLVAAAFIADLTTGPAALPLGTSLRALLMPGEASQSAVVIIWQVRLPVALLALLVGAALSLAGAEMQTSLNNPLASPFTLGVSSAATLGAALCIVLDLSLPFVPRGLVVSANAFLFALGSMLLLQFATRRIGGSVEVLVLFGIALVFGFNALVALVQFVASADALQQLVFWTMGSLSRANWLSISILAAVLACVAPFSLAASWRLTALRLGEERAMSYGIDVIRLRYLSLLRVSLLAATAVSFVGTIGFIGLIGPHAARLMIGEDHRFFLPASMLTGALIMGLASTASKLIVPGVLLPVGIVTALVGLPAFVALIFARGRQA